MSIKKTMVIAISFALLIVMGALLTIYVLHTRSQFEQNITLNSNQTTSSDTYVQNERLEMNIDGIVPGGKPIEYTINIDNAAKDTFKITVLFIEKSGDVLKDYVNVVIGIKGEEKAKFSGTLKELYNAGEVLLGDDVSTSATIFVTFSIDREVGNVIENKESSFEATLTAKKI